MRRILKRFVTRDAHGRALAVQSERLCDDGSGRLQLTHERSAGWCSGCRRPIADLGEIRGICDCCRVRGTCIQCASQCQLCSRRLCGRCRRGFFGPPPLTVCATCQQRLIQRQLVQDRLLLQRISFDREMMRRREVAHVHAMRQAAQRAQHGLHLHAARLRLQRDLAVMREMNRMRLALAQTLRTGASHRCGLP